MATSSGIWVICTRRAAIRPMVPPITSAPSQDFVVLCDDTQHRRDQGDRHADDAVPVAPPGRFLVGKATEGEDEKNGRNDIRHRNDSSIDHDGLTFLNISSMRRVTAKPPTMLMLAISTVPTAIHLIRFVSRTDLQQGTDNDDARYRIGHAHQRCMQGSCHVPDHHVADKAGQHEDREVRHE